MELISAGLNACLFHLGLSRRCTEGGRLEARRAGAEGGGLSAREKKGRAMQRGGRGEENAEKRIKERNNAEESCCLFKEKVKTEQRGKRSLSQSGGSLG